MCDRLVCADVWSTRSLRDRECDRLERDHVEFRVYDSSEDRLEGAIALKRVRDRRTSDRLECVII